MSGKKNLKTGGRVGKSLSRNPYWRAVAIGNRCGKNSLADGALAEAIDKAASDISARGGFGDTVYLQTHPDQYRTWSGKEPPAGTVSVALRRGSDGRWEAEFFDVSGEVIR